jgi:hypothetical protein
MAAYTPSPSTGLDSLSPPLSDLGHPPITSPDDFTENEKALLAVLAQAFLSIQPTNNERPRLVHEELEKALTEMFEGGWHTGQAMPPCPTPTTPMPKEALILVGSLSRDARIINPSSITGQGPLVPAHRKMGQPVYLVVYPNFNHTAAEWKWLDKEQQDLGGDDGVKYDAGMDRVEAKARVLLRFSRLERTHFQHHDRAVLIWMMRKYTIAWQNSDEYEGTRIPDIESEAQSHFLSIRFTLLTEVQNFGAGDPAVKRAAIMESESQPRQEKPRKPLPS